MVTNFRGNFFNYRVRIRPLDPDYNFYWSRCGHHLFKYSGLVVFGTSDEGRAEYSFCPLRPVGYFSMLHCLILD